MNKGIIWDSTKGYPFHVLSWHEMNVPKLGNVRVWIHSKGEISRSDFAYGKDSRSRVTFTFGSLEIQIHGAEFSSISETEKQLRLELAACAPIKTIGSVKSSNFRFIPVGQLEIDHMQCIKACYDRNKFEIDTKIRLVKSDKTPTLVFKNGVINAMPQTKNNKSKERKFRATQENAIAIAKLYSDLTKIGTQKVIKQISIDTGLSSQSIYTALRIARGQKWLTSEGVGKTGGVLSDAGIKAFRESNGSETISRLLNPVEDEK